MFKKKFRELNKNLNPPKNSQPLTKNLNPSKSQPLPKKSYPLPKKSHIQWSRPVGRGGQLPMKLVNAVKAKMCGNFEIADKRDAVFEIIDGQTI